MKKLMWLMVGLAIIAGCSSEVEKKAEPGTEALVVYTVNYPLAYFAERIAGDAVEVVFPEIEGDPAFWQPTSDQIGAYQSADLILLNGASYAKWVPKVSLPISKLVDTSASFASQFVPLDEQISHSHGPGGKHEHGDVAFTTWLDPILAIAQAQAVLDALIRLLPEESDPFLRRFEILENELSELDRQLASMAVAGTSTPLLFSHPVYQYLTHRYHLNGRSVHWEPEEEPSPEQWAAFEQLQIKSPVQWMVWEGTPNSATVERLSDAGVESLIFDPCGNRPAEGDYLSVMQQNAIELSKAFR